MSASINAAQLPSCSSDTAFGLRLLWPPCCIIPKYGPFFSRAFTNRSETRNSRIDFTGIADTPCKKSPFAKNVSEVILSSVIQCFGDDHRIVSFLWFATGLSRMF